MSNINKGAYTISNKPKSKLGIFLLWTGVVLVNSILPLTLAISSAFTSISEILAMLSGIITFIFIYYFIDLQLLKRKKLSERKSLLFASLIKATLQLFIYLEIFIGMTSISLIEWIFGKNILPDFAFTYLTTILTGAFLSIVVAMLFGIITLFKRIKQK